MKILLNRADRRAHFWPPSHLCRLLISCPYSLHWSSFPLFLLVTLVISPSLIQPQTLSPPDVSSSLTTCGHLLAGISSFLAFKILGLFQCKMTPDSLTEYYGGRGLSEPTHVWEEGLGIHQGHSVGIARWAGWKCLPASLQSTTHTSDLVC